MPRLSARRPVAALRHSAIAPYSPPRAATEAVAAARLPAPTSRSNTGPSATSDSQTTTASTASWRTIAAPFSSTAPDREAQEDQRAERREHLPLQIAGRRAEIGDPEGRLHGRGEVVEAAGQRGVALDRREERGDRDDERERRDRPAEQRLPLDANRLADELTHPTPPRSDR